MMEGMMEGCSEAPREHSDGAVDPSNHYSHPGDRTSSGSGQAGEALLSHRGLPLDINFQGMYCQPYTEKRPGNVLY